ncbi:MAG: alpha-L-fucosidase, partial [Kiritimatiellae bacterium]|nr:alpha-L-fucosidase [Kiritimatiellia bacterium]
MERGPRPARTPTEAKALAAWREMRFGMFIHWGLYALPAGKWEGRSVPGLGEWIMLNAHIPRDAYMALAGRFNPVKFDARAWVGLAKRAGMKYLIVTAKHHDGFAIYRSAHPFSMMATPFPRDPLAELAEACREAGLRLGFYYSQYQDWTEPGGSGYEPSTGQGQ